MSKLNPRRLVALFAACAAGLLLLISPTGNAMANATAGALPARAACSTWQYWTDYGAPIYQFAGGTGTATYGVVNVTQFSGDWRGGNFYWYSASGSAVRYNSGWIHISHIHYRQCW